MPTVEKGSRGAPRSSTSVAKAFAPRTAKRWLAYGAAVRGSRRRSKLLAKSSAVKGSPFDHRAPARIVNLHARPSGDDSQVSAIPGRGSSVKGRGRRGLRRAPARSGPRGSP
jgi:hypothetical protein